MAIQRVNGGKDIISICFLLIILSLNSLNSIHCLDKISTYIPGADPGFSEWGSESGVDIEGDANPSIVSLKQGGVWGAQPPRSYGVFNFG